MSLHEKQGEAVVADSIIVLLGMTLLTQFYSLLDCFSAAGFTAKIIDVANYLDFAAWLRVFTFRLLLYAHILGPLLGLTILVAAILMILLIAKGLISILVGIGYLVAWILLWHYPGVWTFEFLFPALFGICAGLLTLNKSFFSHSLFKRLAWPKWAAITVIIFVTLLLGYVTFIASNDFIIAIRTALYSAGTFFMLSLFHLIMDKFISPRVFLNKNNLRAKIAAWPLLDVMIFIIGAMMVMQVYANYYSGLYAIDNYRGLINYYAIASGAHWLHSFLVESAHHAALLSPLQFIFESLLAVFLSLLILQGPVLLLSAFLFGILAFSELGVSADWPPNPHNLTWEWELLLVTIVSFLIGLLRLIEAYHLRSWRYVLLGKQIYKTSLKIRITIALISAAIVYGIGIATQIFGSPYKIISISAAMTFGALLIIDALIDKLRIADRD